MDPNGSYQVKFNVPMMAPAGEIDQKIYGSAFGFNVASNNDGDSNFSGDFGETKRDRMLKGGGKGGISDISKYAFTPKVVKHDSDGIKIAIEFDQPENLSVSGDAGVAMDVKEVSIFKSQATMKSMSTDSFKGGVP